jgi:glycerol-3-phosphate dehydrogenase (NAD(P)+)
MPVTLSILGDGAWGTAIAWLMARNPDHCVRLWSAREENGRILRERRENIHLLPGIRLPDSIALTTDPEFAVNAADLWITAIPTQYLRQTLGRFEGMCKRGQAIVSLTKGIEIGTFRRPTEIIQEILGTQRVAALSGPSHAEEVCRAMPCSVVVGGDDQDLTMWVQKLFFTDRFRVYTSNDTTGVELAGALKNVMGIAAGISDGLGFGDNAKSALLTRGLVEMTRFGVALGADHATFQGLAGVGDLITTCISPHGRNRRVGADGRGGGDDSQKRSRAGNANGARNADHCCRLSSSLRRQIAGEGGGRTNDEDSATRARALRPARQQLI